jgi:GPH family glycoside/pentoside/hexuronide:cation symporter
MLIFSVASVALFFFTFAKTRERVPQPADQKGDFGRDFVNMVGNRAWVALFFSGLFTLINVAVRNGSIIYYFKYVVHDETKFTFYSTSGFLAFIAGAASTKFFLKMGDRRTLMIALSILNAVIIASFYVINPHSDNLLVVLNVVANYVVGPTPPILWSMYADTADYGEWKFGRRSTGLVFSALVFSQKIGLAVGTGAIGWLLAYWGFVANMDQTPSSLRGINMMFSVLPAVLALLGAIAIFFYPITDAKMKDIERDLAQRKAVPA